MTAGTSSGRVSCTKCGAKILRETYARYAGLCRPCRLELERRAGRAQREAERAAVMATAVYTPARMTEEHAIGVAQTLVDGQPRRGFALRLLCAKYEPTRRDWTIAYRLHDPDEPGTVIDGPVLIVVDDVTGVARFF
jgi:hypothetical protein